MRIILFFLLFLGLFTSFTKTIIAADNNKFGIHIVNISKEEVIEAKRLVNSNGGDWGYVTFIIQSDDRDKKKWQGFFDELRRAHLIPIVRIATKPAGEYWEVPREVDAKEWAAFLDSLVWPVDTRYIVIYNEPNHATEWGNTTDPAAYAKVLNDTIDALENKSESFFVMNGGLDVSAPHEMPAYYNAEKFMREMNTAVPGIFEKLDGWSSHSYPNPAFSGSPKDTGRGTVETYKWELGLLRAIGVKKDLPVFITETGWQRGKLTPEQVAEYYRAAFEDVWDDERIVAVTPFILNYTHPPFESFSFKIPAEDEETAKILGDEFPGYYPQYESIYSIKKVKGVPNQKHAAVRTDGYIKTILIPGENYYAHYLFTNNGLSIWGEEKDLQVVVKADGIETEVMSIKGEQYMEPGGEYEFLLKINPKVPGKHNIEVSLVDSKGQIEGSFQAVDFEAIGRIEQIKRLSFSLLNEMKGIIKLKFSRLF